MTEDRPPGWGSDPLSQFIENARTNAFATFHNLKEQYGRLREVDHGFRTLIDYLNNTPNWFAAFFLLRAHSAFLASVSLAISGQVVEAYMTLRGCLEAALYGWHVSRNHEAVKIWLDRDVDDKSRDKCRQEFAIGKLLRALESESAHIHQVTVLLYQRTIDSGGHPNEQAILSMAEMDRSQNPIQLRLNYLIGDTPVLRACLKTTAQVGVCVLDVFSLIYRERMKLTGLSEQLEGLKRGL